MLPLAEFGIKKNELRVLFFGTGGIKVEGKGKTVLGKPAREELARSSGSVNEFKGSALEKNWKRRKSLRSYPWTGQTACTRRWAERRQ